MVFLSDLDIRKGYGQKSFKNLIGSKKLSDILVYSLLQSSFNAHSFLGTWFVSIHDYSCCKKRVGLSWRNMHCISVPFFHLIPSVLLLSLSFSVPYDSHLILDGDIAKQDNPIYINRGFFRFFSCIIFTELLIPATKCSVFRAFTFGLQPPPVVAYRLLSFISLCCAVSRHRARGCIGFRSHLFSFFLIANRKRTLFESLPFNV